MSKYFQDVNNRQWCISINIGSVMRVKDKLGIDLLKIEEGDPPLIQRLWDDELLIAQIIECLLEKQIKDTDENLYDIFDGETLINAQTCFYDELVNFFRASGKTHRAEMVLKMREITSEAMKSVVSQIKKTKYGNTSGNAPGE